jgi:hypothetical protein
MLLYVSDPVRDSNVENEDLKDVSGLVHDVFHEDEGENGTNDHAQYISD